MSFVVRAVSAVAAVSLTTALVACTEEPASTPSPTPTASALPIPQGDGVFTVGTLVPMTGAQGGMGLAQVAGVELAARELNENGGVLGSPVAVYHRDSGDASTDTAETAFAELVERGVDVVIGPSSLELARRLAPLAEDAGVVLVSPAITDLGFDSIDGDLMFRTSPPVASDGAAIAQQVGSASVVLVYLADEVGAVVRASLAAGLEESGGELVDSIRVAPTTGDFSRIVEQVAAADADVVVFSSGASQAEQSAGILTALADAGYAGDRLWLTRALITDRSATHGDTLEGVRGVTSMVPPAEFVPRLRSAEPRMGSARTGAEAYDAVILAALAATVASNDSGRAIADGLASVASQGIPCHSFAECVHVLTTEDDIDYQGVSGPLDLDADGQLGVGAVTVYRYTAEGKIERLDNE